MNCPTCGHTMHCLGRVESGWRYFWCPRCGSCQPDHELGDIDVGVPKLVDRCRTFAKLAMEGDGTELIEQHHEWHRLGIAESINPPSARPSEEHR